MPGNSVTATNAAASSRSTARTAFPGSGTDRPGPGGRSSLSGDATALSHRSLPGTWPTDPRSGLDEGVHALAADCKGAADPLKEIVRDRDVCDGEERRGAYAVEDVFKDGVLGLDVVDR